MNINVFKSINFFDKKKLSLFVCVLGFLDFWKIWCIMLFFALDVIGYGSKVFVNISIFIIEINYNVSREI